MKKLSLVLIIFFIFIIGMAIGFPDAIKMEHNQHKYKKTNKSKVLYLHAGHPKLKIPKMRLTCPKLNVHAPHPLIKLPNPVAKAPHPSYKTSPED